MTSFGMAGSAIFCASVGAVGPTTKAAKKKMRRRKKWARIRKLNLVVTCWSLQCASQSRLSSGQLQMHAAATHFQCLSFFPLFDFFQQTLENWRFLIKDLPLGMLYAFRVKLHVVISLFCVLLSDESELQGVNSLLILMSLLSWCSLLDGCSHTNERAAAVRKIYVSLFISRLNWIHSFV